MCDTENKDILTGTDEMNSATRQGMDVTVPETDTEADTGGIGEAPVEAGPESDSEDGAAAATGAECAAVEPAGDSKDASEGVPLAEELDAPQGQDKPAKKKHRFGISAAAAVVVVAVVALAIGAWAAHGRVGTYTIAVTGMDGQEESYSVRMASGTMRELLDTASESTDFSYGEEADSELCVDYVTTVCGEEASGAAYWIFYVNGEYCPYGIDDTDVKPGDEVEIVCMEFTE